MKKNIIWVFSKISKNKALLSIKQGLLMSIPLVLIGTIAIVINNLPIEAYQDLMRNFLGADWKTWGNDIFYATINITSLVIVFTISYNFANHINTKSSNHAIIAAIVSFVNFLLIIQPEGEVQSISYNYTGGTGLFVAIITALVSTKLFFIFSNVKAFTPNFFANDPEPALIYALNGAIPAILTSAIFIGFEIVMAKVFGITDICRYIYYLTEIPFQQMPNTLPAALLYVFLVHFYWFFGIHGGNILNSINDTLYSVAAQKNIDNIALGIAPEEIFTKPFFDAFVMIGGCGSTLCLIIAVFVLTRKSTSFRLAQLSSLPGIFNINEVLIYGWPIVLNPLLFIPFIFTPIILTLTSYLAISLGLVPYTCANIHWTTPPIIGGYAAVHSWQGVGLQIFNICLGALLYLPFIKKSLTQKDLELKDNLKSLSAVVFDEQPQKTRNIISRGDSVGLTARVLANDLGDALKNNEIQIFYQPIVDKNRTMVGAEALFRWFHPKYGYIPPPVAIKVAEESEQVSQVGAYLFDKVCRQISFWQKNEDLMKFWVSVNISVEQLDDKNIVGQIQNALDKYNVAPEYLEIEVTEQAMLYGDKNINLLSVLSNRGISIAIDDFGMGHSSLKYINLFPVDVLKIDGSLAKDIVDNKNSQEIVRSITDMCQSLNIKVVVEFVETLEQKDVLDQLDCDFYQGYLFSPALPSEKLEEYILAQKKIQS